MLMLRPGPPPSLRRAPPRGFTLIELLFAITLLGILVALGLPSFTGWIRNNQIRTVAEALQDGLRTAQAEAVRRNQAVVVSFTNDANPVIDPSAVAAGKNWSAQTVPSTFIDAGSTTFIKSGVLTSVASNISISNNPTSDARTAICFNGNGRLLAKASPTGSAAAVCSETPAAFDVVYAPDTAGTRGLRVTLSVGGQVRMCDPKRPALSVATPDGCP